MVEPSTYDEHYEEELKRGVPFLGEAMLKDVLRLLSAFGIRGRIYSISGSKESSFAYTRADGTHVEYQSLIKDLVLESDYLGEPA